MKFTVNAGDFDSALRSVQGRARVSTQIPILKSILVTAGEAKVSVLGNDLDSSSFASLDAEVALAGSWAIPADPLIRVVAGLPKAAHIVVEFDGKPRQQVTVKSGRSRYMIPVMPAADFPGALSAKGGVSFDVTAEDLDQLFSRPSGVVDLGRPYLAGAYLHEEAGRLFSCATNGHSLLRFSTQIEAKGFRGVIVPHSALPEIIKIGAGTVSITESAIEIVNGSRSFCSKLIDGTFPDYRRVVPELCSNHVIIDRLALLESLARLGSIEGFSECRTIDATFANDEISITITGLADGSEAIECETAGTEGFFCMQTRNLLEACKTLGGEKIDIFVIDEGSPVRIVDMSEPDAVCIEMPYKSKNRRAQAA